MGITQGIAFGKRFAGGPVEDAQGVIEADFGSSEDAITEPDGVQDKELEDRGELLN